jgi:hypothetical protein
VHDSVWDGKAVIAASACTSDSGGTGWRYDSETAEPLRVSISSVVDSRHVFRDLHLVQGRLTFDAKAGWPTGANKLRVTSVRLRRACRGPDAKRDQRGAIKLVV